MTLILQVLLAGERSQVTYSNVRASSPSGVNSVKTCQWQAKERTFETEAPTSARSAGYVSV